MAVTILEWLEYIGPVAFGLLLLAGCLLLITLVCAASERGD